MALRRQRLILCRDLGYCDYHQIEDDFDLVIMVIDRQPNGNKINRATLPVTDGDHHQAERSMTVCVCMCAHLFGITFVVDMLSW